MVWDFFMLFYLNFRLMHGSKTTFENNNIILGRYPLIWIVERFFAETLGISYQAITHTMRVHWNHPTKFSTNEIEKHVIPVCTVSRSPMSKDLTFFVVL